MSESYELNEIHELSEKMENNQTSLKYEPATLKKELSVRGLMGQLKNKMRVIRPGISDDTIYRAFKVESYDTAGPLIRSILEHGNKILSDDDVRITSVSLSYSAAPAPV